MRALKLGLLVLGIAAIAYSVHRIGLLPILEALARLRWWELLLVCLPYAAITAVDTVGWRYAFSADPAPFWRLLGARLAGEALNLVTALGFKPSVAAEKSPGGFDSHPLPLPVPLTENSRSGSGRGRRPVAQTAGLHPCSMAHALSSEPQAPAGGCRAGLDAGGAYKDASGSVTR